jgi:hypothetical protein
MIKEKSFMIKKATLIGKRKAVALAQMIANHKQKGPKRIHRPMREIFKRKRERQISLGSLKMKKTLRSSLMRKQTFL